MTERKPAPPRPVVRPRPEQADPVKLSGKHVLRLYVAGTTLRTMQAVRSIEDLCVEQFRDQLQIEVVDIYQRPQLDADEQIFSVNALSRLLPEPLRKLITEFSVAEQVLVGLDLLERAD
jgi:circadian clock protein KaiB